MNVCEVPELTYLLRVFHKVLRRDGTFVQRAKQLHRPRTIPIEREHENLFKFSPRSAEEQKQDVVNVGRVLLLELIDETSEADGHIIERPQDKGISTLEISKILAIRETKDYLGVGHLMRNGSTTL